MTDLLFELLRPDRLTSVVDVGANPIDASPPYLPMLRKRICRVTGFEPQFDALAALLNIKCDLESYLPYTIGDGRKWTLYVCHSSGMTGLYRPNQSALKQLDGYLELGRVIKEIPVSTQRLDDVIEIDAIDFLKMDVQGSELNVLRHGRQRLSKAVIVQTEVSFFPLYEGQPTFANIDQELRRAGFIPHCFTDIKTSTILPMTGEMCPRRNQLIEADVVYVRDFTQPQNLSPEQLKHLALVAHHCYESYDLASNCIQQLVSKNVISRESVAQYTGFIANRSNQPD